MILTKVSPSGRGHVFLSSRSSLVVISLDVFVVIGLALKKVDLRKLLVLLVFPPVCKLICEMYS